MFLSVPSRTHAIPFKLSNPLKLSDFHKIKICEHTRIKKNKIYLQQLFTTVISYVLNYQTHQRKLSHNSIIKLSIQNVDQIIKLISERKNTIHLNLLGTYK